MGFLKKLFGTAAVAGAAVGSALYVKKRKETRNGEVDSFDDFDDKKAFEFNKNADNEGNTKVTITINKKKVKKVADDTADKVIDATDKLKNTVTDKIGEENIENMKEKISDMADFAMEKANEAKDMVVEKVGEDNIKLAKDKVANVAATAKEKVGETVDKIFNSADDEYEDIFEDEDIVTKPSDNASDSAETEDDVTVDTDSDDDFLTDELKDL